MNELVTLTTYTDARDKLRVIAAHCKESRKDTLRRLIDLEHKRVIEGIRDAQKIRNTKP